MLPTIVVTDLATAEWLYRSALNRYSEDMHRDDIDQTVGAVAVVALDAEVRRLRAESAEVNDAARIQL